MEKLQKSTTTYIKALSKRSEGEDREKTLPVAHLGGTMINHGEDFESDSEFGQCLISKSALALSSEQISKHRIHDVLGRLPLTFVAQNDGS